VKEKWLGPGNVARDMNNCDEMEVRGEEGKSREAGANGNNNCYSNRNQM